MIKKLHKIPDKVFFRAIVLIIILWNLKYFIMPIQVLYIWLTQDYFKFNEYYSKVIDIRTEIKKYPDFYDEGAVGFVSDLNGVNVFLDANTIKVFFVSQYAIVPSVMKNEINENYLIGAFFKKQNIPEGYVVVSQINQNIYLLKKEDGNND